MIRELKVEEEVKKDKECSNPELVEKLRRFHGVYLCPIKAFRQLLLTNSTEAGGLDLKSTAIQLTFNIA